MKFHTDPLPGCGANVTFADLGAFVRELNRHDAPFDEACAERMRAELDKYGVLVFRDMEDLTPQGHVRLTQMFGAPGAHPRRGKPPALPCLEGTDCLVEVATNDPRSPYRSSQVRADHWHADATFAAAPPSFTTLRACTIPGDGRGDTLYASTSAAFDSLSPALQDILATMQAVHRDRSGVGMSATHPVVVNVPQASRGASPRKALFVNHQFTTRIAGWAEDESAMLLEFLKQRAISPNFVYRHRWAVGDIVVWDNRQTLHYGVYDSGERVRTMHRTTAGYEVPCGSPATPQVGPSVSRL